MTASPLVQAAYLLAREFGWTPRQVRELTMAQISIYLQMLAADAAGTHE